MRLGWSPGSNQSGVNSLLQAYEGKFECQELQFGQPISDRASTHALSTCEPLAASFYALARWPASPWAGTDGSAATQVEKQQAKFFSIYVDQKTIDSGFVIAAHSPTLSKFKLLLFEQTPDGQWELVGQVCRSQKQRRCAMPHSQLPPLAYYAKGLISSSYEPFQT